MWSVDLSNVMMPNADLPGYAVAKRCEIETGESLSTAGTLADRDSQALITGAYSYVQPNPETTVQIKTAVGFVADRRTGHSDRPARQGLLCGRNRRRCGDYDHGRYRHAGLAFQPNGWPKHGKRPERRAAGATLRSNAKRHDDQRSVKSGLLRGARRNAHFIYASQSDDGLDEEYLLRP